MAGASILVLEPSNSKGSELRGHLISAGYHVRWLALPCAQLMDRIGEARPDIVVVDIGIRGDTDAVRAANLVQSRLDIPVIYMMPREAYGQVTLQRSKATGPFGYIFEPFDARQVTTTIEVALTRYHLQREIEEGRQWFSAVLNSMDEGVIAVDARGTVAFINPKAQSLTGWSVQASEGSSLGQILSVKENAVKDALNSALERGREGTGQPVSGLRATLASQSGTKVPVEINLSYLAKPTGGISGMVLVFDDVSEQQRALDEVRRQASRAEALLQVASQLNKQIELGNLLQTVCVTMNRTLNAAATAVFLRDEADGIFRNKAAFTEMPNLQAFAAYQFDLPAQSFESRVTRRNPVHVVTGLQDDPAMPYVGLVRELKLNTLVLAALLVGDELMGALVSVFSEATDAFSADDVALLTGLADQASSAIRNAKLFEQVSLGREREHILARGLADVQESERRRVARELHDELGQALTGLQFMLESAKTGGEHASPKELEEIQECVADIIGQTREISLNLRPSMLDDLGLVPTLKWHFERYSKQTGMEVSFQNDVLPQRYASDIETAAYRIIQEALTNVARHADVGDVFVGLTVQDRVLWLEVLDKGKGFEAPGSSRKPTSGLGGMRERAGLVGGYLTVASYPGKGTQILAALPLDGQVLERRRHERNRAPGR